jgi:carboxyl-terminal processing protease
VSLALLVLLTFSAGYILRDSQSAPAPAVAQTETDREELFRPFWEAWELLHENYVDPLDDNLLMEAALNGFMTSLGDPNMDYMDPARYELILTDLDGEFEGIGATVQQNEETGGLTIVRPLPNSPAEAAGLLPGDEIVTVNGEDITSLDQSLIIAKVRGPAGTDVVLGIRRLGNEDLLEITVTRARITLPSVEYELFDDNIGYIQFYQFSRDSADALSDALTTLDAENLDGLIFDLRGNTGGYLDITLEVVNLFVERGVILIERGPGGAEQKYQASGNALAPTVPMVVLVDAGSASASEIVAGALQDLKRATIIGTTTYGKGTVQTWRRLSNGGGVRITISRWYTPKGRSIDQQGVEPDRVVEFPALEPGTPYSYELDPQLQAAIEYLQGHRSPQVHLPISGVLMVL